MIDERNYPYSMFHKQGSPGESVSCAMANAYEIQQQMQKEQVMAIPNNPPKPENDCYGPLELLIEAIKRSVEVRRYGNQPKKVLVRMENCPGDVNMEIEVKW